MSPATAKSPLGVPFSKFAQDCLPLLCSPEVTIQIGSNEQKYRFPKDLLCSQSAYFKAMFQEERFKEGVKQSATLEEIEGVLSNRSFDMLAQYICTGQVVFGALQPGDAVALCIEFSRLADMCQVSGAESSMAEHIKRVVLADAQSRRHVRQIGTANLLFVTPQHVESAALLKNGHPVRKVLAEAMVEGFFRKDELPLQEQLRDVPGFAWDVLNAIKTVSKQLRAEANGVNFVEPFSRESFKVIGSSTIIVKK